MYEYTNVNGVKFKIEVEEANLPSKADYYGYLFLVQVDSEDPGSGTHKAIVKKELCDSKKKAEMWLHTTALDFLKTILDTYENGKTLILLPGSDKWWVI